jgi:hypothetical protein
VKLSYYSAFGGTLMTLPHLATPYEQFCLYSDKYGPFCKQIVLQGKSGAVRKNKQDDQALRRRLKFGILSFNFILHMIIFP